MGLYTPTILGGNSYLSWFNDRGAVKDQAHIGTSKGLSQAINRGPIRKFLPKYANVYVTIRSHGFSEGVWTHYVTVNGVRNGHTQKTPPLLVIRSLPAMLCAGYGACAVNETLSVKLTAGGQMENGKMR